MPVSGGPLVIQSDLSPAVYHGAGVGKYVISVSFTLSTISNAAQFHVTPGHAGRLIKATMVAHTPASTASRLATLTPSIGGVNLLGGVLSLTTVALNTIDKELAATAITGRNVFTATQSILWTGSAVTAFAEGSAWLQMEIINDDTLKVLALAMGGLKMP